MKYTCYMIISYQQVYCIALFFIWQNTRTNKLEPTQIQLKLDNVNDWIPDYKRTGKVKAVKINLVPIMGNQCGFYNQTIENNYFITLCTLHVIFQF